MASAVKDMLRAVSAGLQIPTIIILLCLVALTVVLLGSLVVEYFTERKQLSGSIPELIDSLQGKNGRELAAVIKNSGLLQRQKAALLELVQRENLPLDTRIALAKKLLLDEEKHYVGRVRVSDLISKIAPMFGLMGTLIPLAPGLIALGQGDTKTLSDSLLIAFDTTVAGLISAALSLFISSVRKSWYAGYSSSLEAVMDAVLDCEEAGDGPPQKIKVKVSKTGGA
ncbi:MAG: MotA/TolQ/ExbB proton channel family protein [Acutalibacteraceae bacterium]|nr:MotA/TolQ/ExbB proton channel family protein [Clostridia bacterium]MEE1293531.1 MotA/TolQ/ExbB proton channel family protein [Acutalibacteraceae bacterium]